jgi:hypothetical protein
LDKSEGCSLPEDYMAFYRFAALASAIQSGVAAAALQGALRRKVFVTAAIKVCLKARRNR